MGFDGFQGFLYLSRSHIPGHCGLIHVTDDLIRNHNGGLLQYTSEQQEELLSLPSRCSAQVAGCSGDPRGLNSAAQGIFPGTHQG